MSLLMSKTKLVTAVVSKRLDALSTEHLSQNQYVTGRNREMCHAILRARDAITEAEAESPRHDLGVQSHAPEGHLLELRQRPEDDLL